MAHRYLVSLDGSELSESVLARVVELAKETGASLVLCRVVVPPEVGAFAAMAPLALPDDTLLATTAELRTEATEYLSSIASRLAADGVSCETLVREGLPAPEILAAQRESGADLIAMATHGRTGLSRLVLGSVAEEVLRQAHTPVLLVPPQAARRT